VPLDDAGRRLVEKYVNIAEGAAWTFWKRAPRAELDEVRAIAYAGLCQGVARFPDYQAEHGYALDDHRYLVAFLNLRVRGAIGDWARSQDWVTRSQRNRLKAIDAACPQGGTTAELAAAAGLTEEQVLDAQQAVAASPVAIDGSRDADATELDGWKGGIADPAADVEGQVVVGGILGAALRAVRSLPGEQQLVLAMRYFHGLPLADVAEAFGITAGQVRELHEDAILRVHEAMLAAASG
jgi:RNA polymerase sigma factor (sigma-70 family)